MGKKSVSDIETKEDIQIMIDRFYTKVRKDPTIGPFFLEVVDIHWEEHMPIMYSFWESVLFNKPAYQGNPIAKHLEINELMAIEQHHFDKWLQLFHETVDDLFVGPLADNAKVRADSIARLMIRKINS